MVEWVGVGRGVRVGLHLHKVILGLLYGLVLVGISLGGRVAWWLMIRLL
jgi:pimeloyl-ACP methyl ester carboxylesterase